MAASKPTPADTGAAPHYRVPPEPNRWPAIGLAVGVHALLLAFLVIGVSWQNNTPVAVEAEVWDMTVQTAAPPPPPEPEPEPEPETPPPEPTPRAVSPPPPPVEQPAPPKQPDIALEREKKRQEELKRKEEARVERERELAEQKRIEQKREDEKKAKLLAEKKEKEKELADKKAREEAEKKEAEKKEAEKKEAEQKKKDEAEKKKKAEAEKKKQDAAEQKKRDAARAEEMRRITGAAGSPTSGGSAAQSTAPRIDKGYVAAITAKVKGNTSYAGDLDEPGNPTVTFRVEQLPTGDIISIRKTKSSGVPAFDDAVEKGIRKSEPLPKKKDGTVERTLEINFRMKDLQ